MLIRTIKIKEGFVLRELGGEFCLAYESDTNNGALNGLPSLNETGIFYGIDLKKVVHLKNLSQLLFLKSN